MATRVGLHNHVFLRLRALNRNPDRWVLLAAAAAWIVLAARPHPPGGLAHDARNGLLGLGVMVMAMMLPMSIGGVRAAARTHGSRGSAGFLVGYLAVWMLAMLIIQQAWTLAAAHLRWTHAVIGIAILAALWEMGPAKRWRMRECTAAAPSRSREWSGVGAAGVGVRAGGSCVGACWALMAACVALAHSPAVMAILFGVQMSGRYWPAASPAWRALAVLGACLASLSMGMAGHHT